MEETTSFRIMLNSPQVHQINLESVPMHRINLTTPVAFGGGNAKVSIDTVANWSLKLDYIPQKGEIIIYSDRNVVDNVNYPGIKIGDGSAYVVDLPFVGDDITDYILGALDDHVRNSAVHVNSGEREHWNNKLNCDINGETLILERDEIHG